MRALSFISFSLLSVASAQAELLQGVWQPESFWGVGAGVQSIEDNPAGPAMGSPLELNYTYLGKTGKRSANEGHALHLGMSLVDGYIMTLGMQRVDGLDSKPFKFTWGHAFRLSDALSLGVSWHHFHDDDAQSGLDTLNTWDVGLLLRPIRWLSAGVALTDFTTPRNDVDRAWQLGLAIRPGTEALTISGGTRIFENGDPIVGAGLNLHLFSTFSILGRYEASDFGEDLSHRFLIGLQDEGRLGAGLFGFSSDAGKGFQGLGVNVHYRKDAEQWHLTERKTMVEVTIGSLPEIAPKGWLSSGFETPFLEMMSSLAYLTTRNDVGGIMLILGDLDFGWAKVEELRTAILDLRASGIKVIAYISSGDTKSYALASAADSIYMPPAGMLALTGLRQSRVYLKEGLARLGVEADFIAVGDYKSAPEIFTRTEPSQASESSDRERISQQFDALVEDLAIARNKSSSEVREIISKAPFSATSAQAAGLIDGVIAYDELDGIARNLIGQGVRFVPIQDLDIPGDNRWGRLPTVAVLYAVGDIVDGESELNPISGEYSTGAVTFVNDVRRLASDSKVEAVVLRIDSPGGSVSASDAMWRELKLLAEHKPLIVSLSDVAASGGYYIAAPAKEIWTSNATVTGSIGIFAGKFNIGGLLQKLSLHPFAIEMGENAGFNSPARKWSDSERSILKGILEEGYELFLNRVAAGRPLDVDGVRPLAGGRVWSGRDALKNKLADHKGGFLDAIDRAATLAGLEPVDYQLAFYGPQTDRHWMPMMNLALPGVASQLQTLSPIINATLVQPFKSVLSFLALYNERPLALLPVFDEAF